MLEFRNLLKDDFTEQSPKGFTLEPKINHDALHDWELLTDEEELDIEDWEFLTQENEFDMQDWVLPEKPNRIENHGLLLKLNDISGQVFGLAFNNQHGNVLACGGSFEKLKLYNLDQSIKTYELVDAGSSSCTTFLDWHPRYPVIIASSCDDATAKIWDLRTKKLTHSINQTNKHCSEIHWNPNHPVEFVVGSIGEDTTVKIWDLRNTCHPLSSFGPEKGVVSLSWCRNQELIITTAVDGGLDCWKLNVVEGSDPSRRVYLPPLRRSLPLGKKEETAWLAGTDNVMVASSSLNIGLYKVKSPW